MNKQAVQNIEAFFKKRSVELGNVPRYNNVSMWPFWYSLIPDPPQNDVLFPFPATKPCEGIGWPIAAGAYRDIPIILDQDAVYHHVNYKLGAYRGILQSAPAGAGNISIAANALAVVGVNTLFLQDFQPGDVLVITDDNNERRFGVVDTVGGNLAMNLESSVGPNACTNIPIEGLPAAAGGLTTIGNQWYETGEVSRLTGGIQVNAAGAVVGVGGTAFNAQLNVGQQIAYVDDTGTHQVYPITAIAGAAAMTLNGGAATGVAAGAPNGVAYKIAPVPHLTFNRFRPLHTYLRSSLIMKSNRDTYVLGGNHELTGNAVYAPPSLGGAAGAGGLQERPHSARSLQGFDDGLCSIYTPFQAPKDGTVMLRVHNTHDFYTLYVNGALFGYKVGA